MYPTNGQIALFEQTLTACRHAYNWMLDNREDEYTNRGYSLTCYDQIKRLSLFRQTWEELQTVHSQVLQNVAVRVDLAFKAFFRRVKAGEEPGYPRFKGRDGYDSFTYPQSGFSVKENIVKLSKIGEVKIKLHRPIIGKIKTCTIRRQNDKWYVCFSCEVEEQILPATGQSIGIDVGLEKFASTSDGTFVENPRFFRKEEEALAKAQRKLSKQTKGTKEWREAKKVVARIHERIKNRRHNFIHQLSRKLVNENDVIVVEKLNVDNMVKNHCLSKSIHDASWTQFRYALDYKAASAGRKLILVNPAYTSQDCSGCGFRAKKPLKERWHLCPMCGLSLDRDVNAAINILRLGLQSLVGAPHLEAPGLSRGE